MTAPLCPIPTTDGKRGTRSNQVGMTRPMAEAWQPRRSWWPAWVRTETQRRRDRLIDMLDLTLWLDVERSKRWTRNERGGTYCDHYAADWYSQWLGRGTPVVPPLSSWLWWRDDDCDAPPVYGDTVIEHGATGTYDWLLEHAEAYGWVRLPHEVGARDWVEAHARPGLVIARRVGGGASHVAVVLPDAVEDAARARGIGLTLSARGPLTTEAGGRNRMLTRRRWWTGDNEGVQWLGLP